MCQQTSIINKYLSGYSISKLLNEFPEYNRRQITQILIENDIEIKGGRHKKTISNNDFEMVKQKIKDGITLEQLAKDYNLDKETMRNILNEQKLKTNARVKNNRNLQEDYFNIIDCPEKAYWLGFLYTDGSVDHYQKTGRLRISVQEQDKELLEQFKIDLNSNSVIRYDKRKNSVCCYIEISNEQIFKDLSKYGIVPQKTYKSNHIPYQSIPVEYLQFYILGLFDGDDSLIINQNDYTDVSINYTAYYQTEVEDFQLLINNLINNEKYNKNFFTSAWHTQWRGRRQVLKILDALYKNAPRFLKRKKKKYIQLKNSLS